MRNKRHFVVLGGVGAIGRVVVRDLLESHAQNRVLIADFNEKSACQYARSFCSRRVSAVFANASKPEDLASVLEGHSVVINCTQHDFNLKVMRAALAAHLHYLDLGGLFCWTRRQLKLDNKFRRSGLTAILGMGCAPGITNVLARYAVDSLECVESVRIRVGSRDFSGAAGDFYFPYSAQTVLEELTLAPCVYARNQFRQVPPRTGWERLEFPKPVGTLWLVRTRHSEVATIPLSFSHKGLRSCDFKVSFDRSFVRQLMKRLHSGWTIERFLSLPASRVQPNDYEIARVLVVGHRVGESSPITITLDCHARAKPEWHARAGDVDTGCPPSIVAQWLATGVICHYGVLAPEQVVPPKLFFQELERRGMKLLVRVDRPNSVSP